MTTIPRQLNIPENRNSLKFGPFRFPHSSFLSLVTELIVWQCGHFLIYVLFCCFFPLNICISDEK